MKSAMVSGLSALLLASAGIPAIAAPQVAVPQNKQTNASLRTAIRQDETLYLDNDTAYEYNLRLESETTVDGLRLPVGSIVRGSFEPIDGGLQYVANSVEVSDRIYPLSAASELLADQKDPRQTDTGDIVEDAAIGAAGGVLIGEVLGDVDLWEVIGGAAAGVIVGNTTAPSVVVIEPDETIVLYTR
ncbi:MAG: hypothetical protein F6J97_05200 [Leptolyngbya sp. SIO4C1]|nr:hypothetical protein [Leptolyngbya sp. SIO4C1]